MRSPLAVLLLLLACCGSGGGPDGPCPLNLNVEVTLVDTLPGVVGDCDRCRGDGNTYIRVRSGMDRVVTIRVIAHELGHAAGLTHDYDADPDCLMNQTPSPSLDDPCSAELNALLANIGNLSFVVSVSPVAYDDAREAANLWNTAAGRPVFTIL